MNCANGSGDHLRIGLVRGEPSDPSANSIVKAIRTRAIGRSEIVDASAGGAAPGLGAQMDSLIARGVKAMAISLSDGMAAEQAIGKAKDKRIPLVFFGLCPNADDMVKWDKVFYVGARPGEAGTFQGEIAADWWKAHPEADRNRDGRMQYVLFTGEPGQAEAIGRSQFCVKALDAAGIKADKLYEESASKGRLIAQEEMAACLARFGSKIEFVLCNDDEIALGAIDALKAAPPAKAGKAMPVVGIDAEPAALEAIKAGALIGSVLQDRESQGKAVHDLSLALAMGGKLDDLEWPLSENKYLWVQSKKITAQNVDTFIGK